MSVPLRMPCAALAFACLVAVCNGRRVQTSIAQEQRVTQAACRQCAPSEALVALLFAVDSAVAGFSFCGLGPVHRQRVQTQRLRVSGRRAALRLQVSEEELQGMTVATLKDKLKDVGLKANGNKAALIERLREHYASTASPEAEEDSEGLDSAGDAEEVSAASSEPEEDLQSLKVTELRERLKAANLKVAGTKAELIKRLQEHVDTKAEVGGGDELASSVSASDAGKAAAPPKVADNSYFAELEHDKALKAHEEALQHVARVEAEVIESLRAEEEVGEQEILIEKLTAEIRTLEGISGTEALVAQKRKDIDVAQAKINSRGQVKQLEDEIRTLAGITGTEALVAEKRRQIQVLQQGGETSLESAVEDPPESVVESPRSEVQEEDADLKEEAPALVEEEKQEDEQVENVSLQEEAPAPVEVQADVPTEKQEPAPPQAIGRGKGRGAGRGDLVSTVPTRGSGLVESHSVVPAPAPAPAPAPDPAPAPVETKETVLPEEEAPVPVEAQSDPLMPTSGVEQQKQDSRESRNVRETSQDPEDDEEEMERLWASIFAKLDKRIAEKKARDSAEAKAKA